jgi:hypothetical protein
MNDDEFFVSWLTQKSEQVISKLGREKLSTEEMLILILKNQSKHISQLEAKLKLVSTPKVDGIDYSSIGIEK